MVRHGCRHVIESVIRLEDSNKESLGLAQSGNIRESTIVLVYKLTAKIKTV